jgi:cytochrome c553
MKALLAACLLALACAAGAQAPSRQAAPARAAAVAHGSPQAGQQIATAGAPNGVTACSACHGAKGEGNPAGNFPMLTGQPEAYLLHQLLAFTDATRPNAVMTPIAKAMTQQQMRDVSAWYASLDPPAVAAVTPAAKPPAALMQRGMTLATKGDEAKQVQACNNCHGPGGAGEAPTYPALAGQHAGYLTAAMAEWKSGVRKTDPSGQMPAIARPFDDRDVAALAAYYAAQPPQAPAKRVNVAAGSAARPAVAARADSPGPPPAAGAPQPQGVGSEQGAPLTGGSQGPGGGGGTQGSNPPQSQQPQQKQPPPPPPKTGERR